MSSTVEVMMYPNKECINYKSLINGIRVNQIKLNGIRGIFDGRTEIHKGLIRNMAGIPCWINDYNEDDYCRFIELAEEMKEKYDDHNEDGNCVKFYLSMDEMSNIISSESPDHVHSDIINATKLIGIGLRWGDDVIPRTDEIKVSIIYDHSQPMINVDVIYYKSVVDSIESNRLRCDFVDKYMHMSREEQDKIDGIVPEWVNVAYRWALCHGSYKALESNINLKGILNNIKPNPDIYSPVLALTVTDYNYIMVDSVSTIKKEISELWDKIADIL